MKRRPAVELVVIILAVAVGVTLVVMAVGLFALLLWQPGRDVSAALHTFGVIMGALVGSVLGYLAGRRENTNGAP